jgi:hypothetical protein
LALTIPAEERDQHPVMMTEFETVRGNLGIEEFSSPAP